MIHTCSAICPNEVLQCIKLFSLQSQEEKWQFFQKARFINVYEALVVMTVYHVSLLGGGSILVKPVDHQQCHTCSDNGNRHESHNLCSVSRVEHCLE